jgi:hypothetical protein
MDLDAAVAFVATHGRVLEWRRLQGPPEGLLAALEAFRNPDGGYGWGLEPDLRSATSQPVAAMHALEVFAEAGPGDPRAVRLADWLGAHALADGGMPMSLPFSDTAGSAAHWVGADPAVSSLQMTAQLAAQAHRAGLAGHPWLAGATDYCLAALEGMTAAPGAYDLLFGMRFLDAVAGESPRARGLLERFAGFVRTDGPTPVDGGVAGEVMHPLDFTPERESASRALFDPAAIEADLARLAGQQQADGGWTVSFPPTSPAALLEWRGYATVQAIRILTG